MLVYKYSYARNENWSMQLVFLFLSFFKNDKKERKKEADIVEM